MLRLYFAFLTLADINTSLENLAGILQGFIVGALTVAFCYGGYLWMTSTNNPSRRSEAYGYLFGAAFGAIAVVLAKVIAGQINGAMNTQ
jgi:hypothetical protein